MADITLPRKPVFSNSLTPLIVVPPGEQTASFMIPGCSLFSKYKAPTPSIILAARR